MIICMIYFLSKTISFDNVRYMCDPGSLYRKQIENQSEGEHVKLICVIFILSVSKNMFKPE